jgi:galactokinase/galacturonokinase
MALIDPSKAETVLRTVGEAYLKAYPGLEGKYSACICHSADGVGVSM